jgi:hypothetical protein
VASLAATYPAFATAAATLDLENLGDNGVVEARARCGLGSCIIG